MVETDVILEYVSERMGGHELKIMSIGITSEDISVKKNKEMIRKGGNEVKNIFLFVFIFVICTLFAGI